MSLHLLKANRYYNNLVYKLRYATCQKPHHTKGAQRRHGRELICATFATKHNRVA